MMTAKRVVVGLIGVLAATTVSAQTIHSGGGEIGTEELTAVKRESSVIAGSGEHLRRSGDLIGVLADGSSEAGTEETSIENTEVPASASVTFPLSSDTWDVDFYPNWFNDGDTVHGTRSPPGGAVTHADVAVKISRNNLSSGNGGFIDFDFEIDGTPVCFLLVTEYHGLGYVFGSCNFPANTPPFELRLTEVNQVVSGGGSISLDEAGASWVTFSTNSFPALVFYDGFEPNSTSNWTNTMP